MSLELPEKPGQAREQAIRDLVCDGQAEYTWETITSTHGDHTAEFSVFADALKIQGVRVGMSAETKQIVADMLGCSLPTAKLADLIWLQRQVTLPPFPHGNPATMHDTAAMLKHSAKIDAALEKLGNLSGLICTTGKLWILDNSIADGRFLQGFPVACNYGWPFVGPAFEGIKGEVLATQAKDEKGQYIRLIQGRGTRHNNQHSDYCLAPETRVLTADLRWVPIKSVVIGDELVGFDEQLQNHGKLRRATVQSVSYLMEDCYEITTSKATIIASGAHRWPVRDSQKVLYKGKANGTKWASTRRKIGWVQTDKLKVGDLIPYLCDPWSQDTSWDGAWMAGFIDGEGWLSGTSFGLGQNPGQLLDRAVEIIRRNGMSVSLSANKQGCVRINVLGARGALRALGTFRPLRLMAKSSSAWEGRRTYGGRTTTVDASAEVLSIRHIGAHPVVGVGTSTGTLIAEGLLSHNSQICVLVSLDCTLDGQPAKLYDILQDPELAPLASHQGVLKCLRQPGVPEHGIIIA